MVNMKYLLNRRSFIPLMILFSFFDNFGMETEDMEGENNVHTFEVVFVGDASVGKTQIVNKFMKNSFKKEYKPTTNVKCSTKAINFNEKNIKLDLWDTAGQENCRNLSKILYGYSHLIVLVYAVDDKKSFENIQSWVEDVKNNTNGNPKFLLVGNKCDLEEERQVSREEAQKYAEDNGIKFFEVSAKTGKGINEMFQYIISKLLNDMEKEEISYGDKDNNTNKIEQKDLLDDQYIYDIKNKKNFCWMEYCSCCPCWEKTEGNGEEEEEVEEEQHGEAEDDKKSIKKNNIDPFKIYIEIIAFLKSVVRQHNALASAAIEQQQLFIIHHTLRFDSFCEKHISSFQKCCAEDTTI